MQILFKITGRNYESVKISMDHSNINGYYLVKKESAISKDVLMVCEMVTKFDKRRIYLRSPVQVINTLDFEIAISYPLDTEKNNSSYSFTVYKWGEKRLMPSKKWYLPMQTLSEAFSDYIKICPVSK